MNTLREINLDLDNIVVDVERVYSKFSTAKKVPPKEPSYVSQEKRNYHGPLDREEMKRSFSPQRQGSRNYRED